MSDPELCPDHPGPAELEIVHAELACGAETIGHCQDPFGRPRYIHECRFDENHHGPHECGCGHAWTEPDDD